MSSPPVSPQPEPFSLPAQVAIIAAGVALSIGGLTLSFVFAFLWECEGYVGQADTWICDGAAGRTLPMVEWLLVVTAIFSPAIGAIMTARGMGVSRVVY